MRKEKYTEEEYRKKTGRISDATLGKLPPLCQDGRNTSQRPLRLQLVKPDFQQEYMEERERKMIAIYEQQQQNALEKVRQMFQNKYPLQRQYHSARDRYDNVYHDEQDYDTTARKTSGADKAFPLKSVYYKRAYSVSSIYRPNTEHVEPLEAQRLPHHLPVPSLDYPDRDGGRSGRRGSERQLPDNQVPVVPMPSSFGEASTRSRGRGRGSQWLEGRLEEDQMRLEEQIRRKEIVLQEKLRRVVEELGKIQREKYTSVGERRERIEVGMELSPDRSSEADFQLLPCKLCHRNFAADRLEKHRKVCEKVQYSKRKVFDSSKYRAKGTDLEEYMKTNTRRKSPELKKSNWRQKHVVFIRNLRQARMPTKGGLRPQLPMDDPDYQPCPHCGRRFAPGPAERHIPMCQNIKSRPPPPRRHVKLR
ncbi:hypothetical protein SKAU_G00338650 [Synaphobranchus kaupii]|uniref:C2HC/C3H-type domain-containing protein n=1 Tax=Synaphobranchus kaupii TaxID=118154 RepID=A0A9Q1EMM1_SYNKA|nr:hypothetical protein SKAU_G00338650 [Synaphobranchus kaupii]